MLARLTVHGVQGGFIVYTGASLTELDTGFTARAKLSNAGAATKVGAGSCSTSVQPVTFDNAAVGSVKPPTVVAASSKNAVTEKSKGKEQGLLGSDILSSFVRVTFDLINHKVVLG